MAHPFYVTTPIYYVNARPHIGHAYTTVVADVLARRHRLLGEPTWFLTGTDEHGQKIERSAAAAGIAPQQFADEVSASFSTLWKRMGITNDQFIRTTDEAHKQGAQKLFTELYHAGKIYLSKYTGQYCVSEEMFVEGPPGTLGPDGRPTETVTEENFFFKLSEYQLPLLNLIESNELSITPESRKNEVLSFLRGLIGTIFHIPNEALGFEAGIALDFNEAMDRAVEIGMFARTKAGTEYVPGALKDLSVSRSSFTWGIPVPEAVQREAGATKPHVIYVWLDALANYITALGYGSDDESKFKEFWPADVQLVGKEIIRFHCVYWPAFLLAADLPLPKAVTAHGWLLFDDSKMSKSKGNIVRTETILEAFGRLCPPQRPDSEPTGHERDLFAADVLRYFLLREIPFGQDGSFTFEALVTRYNADLANGYGNLVSRVLTMIGREYSGELFQVQTDQKSIRTRLEFYLALRAGTREEDYHDFEAVYEAGSFERFEFASALQLISKMIGITNEFYNLQAPWKCPADESESAFQSRRGKVLRMAWEDIRYITALLYPILPFATANVWRQLGLGDIEQAARNGELNNLAWGGLKPGTKLGPLSPVFPRADKGLAQQMSDMEATKYTPQLTEQNDAATGTHSDFPEAPISSEAGSKPAKPTPSKLVDETFAAKPAPTDTFDPAAGPRTSAMPEQNPGAQVAGSNAATTERESTPSHTEAGSGIFAAQPVAPAGPADASPEITIDDFAKIELRIAKVLVCERIPKADKLLRLEVDLGYEQRQILSGIAEWYTPEDLIGRRIVVITNLAPRKMRGLLSHGMLLAASSEGGKPALATFLDSDDLPLGSRLK